VWPALHTNSRIWWPARSSRIRSQCTPPGVASATKHRTGPGPGHHDEIAAWMCTTPRNGGSTATVGGIAGGAASEGTAPAVGATCRARIDNPGIELDVTTAAQAVVRARWFPADVMASGRLSQWSRCYVLATDTELCIFTRVSEEPMWRSPIQWDSTTLPDDEQRTRNGFDVHTDVGLVVITLGSGCRCGSLGRWAGPSWAQLERVRA
jgi:hypothetical protein